VNFFEKFEMQRVIAAGVTAGEGRQVATLVRLSEGWKKTVETYEDCLSSLASFHAFDDSSTVFQSSSGLSVNIHRDGSNFWFASALATLREEEGMTIVVVSAIVPILYDLEDLHFEQEAGNILKESAHVKTLFPSEHLRIQLQLPKVHSRRESDMFSECIETDMPGSTLLLRVLPDCAEGNYSLHVRLVEIITWRCLCEFVVPVHILSSCDVATRRGRLHSGHDVHHAMRDE
jgi:hypothetical protein